AKHIHGLQTGSIKSNSPVGKSAALREHSPGSAVPGVARSAGWYVAPFPLTPPRTGPRKAGDGLESENGRRVADHFEDRCQNVGDLVQGPDSHGCHAGLRRAGTFGGERVDLPGEKRRNERCVPANSPASRPALQLASPQKIGAFVVAFGQDAEGELYVLTNGWDMITCNTGKVYKLTPM